MAQRLVQWRFWVRWSHRWSQRHSANTVRPSHGWAFSTQARQAAWLCRSQWAWCSWRGRRQPARRAILSSG